MNDEAFRLHSEARSMLSRPSRVNLVREVVSRLHNSTLGFQNTDTADKSEIPRWLKCFFCYCIGD